MTLGGCSTLASDGSPDRLACSRFRLVVSLALALAGAACVGSLKGPARLAPPLPAAPHLDLTPAPLLSVTITVDWQPVAIPVTRRMVVSDPALWQQMYIGDWDRLPASLRTPGLQAMVSHYAPVIGDPDSWREMTASDWDEIPQPIRGIAFMRMIAAWAEHDGLRARTSSGRDVTEVVQAIAMTESWFNHRATHTNAGGDVDMGLGQLSRYARCTLARLASRGTGGLDVVADADYFDPMVSARRLVFWFGLMLEEAGGDADLAIRAYNQGIGRARAGGGDDYLRDVTRVLKRYISTAGMSPTWQYLRAELAASRHPGLAGHPAGVAVADGAPGAAVHSAPPARAAAAGEDNASPALSSR
jgi:hypothetical protein